jgi:3-isopropylmalate/(R)-2-methylmalate dehydratase large subunit
MIAPDDTTFDYITARQRPMPPPAKIWIAAMAYWRTLPSDADAAFDRTLTIDAAHRPAGHLGNQPRHGHGYRPARSRAGHSGRVQPPDVESALDYMGLTPGHPLDRCTRGCGLYRQLHQFPHRRSAPGRRHPGGPQEGRPRELLVVPGSHAGSPQAEAEGLDRIFKAAGGQWRYAGCSMCLGMNPDQLRPQQRCASTSNRNFEGRQGKGGRTHLVSPEMAAAAAVAGKFVDIRTWLSK